jgi:hypothetical protein
MTALIAWIFWLLFTCIGLVRTGWPLVPPLG